jgi:hypothetical protein
MIRKNVKVGNVKCDVIDFGFGSVSMQPGYFEDEKSPTLMLKTNTEPREIGEQNSEWIGKNSDDYQPEIAMIFKNEESLNALIESLEDCRDHFKL